MPSKDERTKASLRGGKLATSGRMNVTFIDGSRNTQRALVLGQGTTSGLKLRVGVGLARRIVDNVPKKTAHNSTNCYVSRI